MKVLYNLEQIMLFLLITVYHMFLLMLYMMLHDNKSTMAKFMQAMMMGNMSVMTMGEMQDLRDLFNMFPSVWKNLLLSQTWCLLVPIILINRFAYAKLTQQAFRMQWVNIMDVWIFCFFCVILNYHFEWESAENMGMGLERPPTADLMYTQAY